MELSDITKIVQEVAINMGYTAKIKEGFGLVYELTKFRPRSGYNLKIEISLDTDCDTIPIAVKNRILDIQEKLVKDLQQ